MIHVSDAFRRSVREGRLQRAVLRFDNGTYLTNEDIGIQSGGITFNERFNESTDLTMGAAPSSSIRVVLNNKDGKFDNFAFGRFTAAIGACIEDTTLDQTSLRRRGYVGQTNRNYTVVYGGNTVTEQFDDGTRRVYELAKLGTFIAPRPEVVKKSIIYMDADDQMTLLDDKWAKDLSVSYPITLGNLLAQICATIGVTLKTPSFLNSGLLVESAPEEFEEATLREVVGWIAEAACAYARFDRDGLMEVVWFNPTSERYDEHDYSDFTPYSYQVHAIEQLNVRNQNSDEEAILGGGSNAYMIQDNPFLRQDDGREDDSEDEGDSSRSVSAIAAAPYADAGGVAPIYNRLAGFSPFNPSSADLFTDWSVQAGDVVTVSSKGESYSLPVYSMTMDWAGAPKITLESTGNETRDPLPEWERRMFSAGRSGYGTRNGLKDLDTWARINVDEINGRIDLEAGRIDEANGLISEAFIAIDGANASIDLVAKRTSELEGWASEAGIRIDGAEADIKLWAQRVESVEGRISQAEIDINGKEGSIGLKTLVSNLNDDLTDVKKDYETLSALVDEVGESVSGANIQIDAANARITEWAGRTEKLENDEGLLETRVSNAEILIDGANARIDLKADLTTVTETTAGLETRIKNAEIDIDAAKADILLKADSSAVTEIAEQVKSAQIDIDGLNGTIKLKADSKTVTDLSERVNSAEVAIDGARAQIDLKASSEDLDALEGRVKSAEIAIDGQKGEISIVAQDAKNAQSAADVAKATADNANASSAELWNWAAAAGNVFAQKAGIISTINVSPESITIAANRVNLVGFVTAEQFAAEVAAIKKLFTDLSVSGNAVITGTLNANGGSVLSGTVIVKSGNLSIGGTNGSWQSMHVVTGVSTRTRYCKSPSDITIEIKEVSGVSSSIIYYFGYT